ncbi:uncharacterized protein RCC_09870 [Ramularia collo-cygni]|uniref:EthD domain-containing protein n=1 Tax=Ramularia collo-cygni TaxID=112498 RepID=A0A2D3V825_9PEZI|nr:uncharacterized protein RCC_09870 [Ramularia collo-cygni]CZT24153.1 uncharacterized protein RCC_09870 [Ramularia collo-cygni]
MSQETFVYVSYPRTPDIKFDSEYYLRKHMALVDEHWKQFGLKSWTVVEFPEGDASGMHTQAILRFDNADGFEKAIAANIPEVMKDIENYSNVSPVRWFGKVTKEG